MFFSHISPLLFLLMKCALWSSSGSSHFKVVDLFCIFFASRKSVMSSVKSRSLDVPLQFSLLSFPLPSFIFLLKLLCCSKCVEILEADKETFSEQDGQHLPDLQFLHKNCNLMPQEAAGLAPTPRRPSPSRVVMRTGILFV